MSRAHHNPSVTGNQAFPALLKHQETMQGAGHKPVQFLVCPSLIPRVRDGVSTIKDPPWAPNCRASLYAPGHLLGVRYSLLIRFKHQSLEKRTLCFIWHQYIKCQLCNFSYLTWNSFLSSNSLSISMSGGVRCLLEWMDLLKRHPYLD